MSTPLRWPNLPLSTESASLRTSATTAASSNNGQSTPTCRQSSNATSKDCRSQAQGPPSPNNSSTKSCKSTTQAWQLRGRRNSRSCLQSCAKSCHHLASWAGSSPSAKGATPPGASPGELGSTKPSSQRSKHQLRLWVSSPPRSSASSPQRNPVSCK